MVYYFCNKNNKTAKQINDIDFFKPSIYPDETDLFTFKKPVITINIGTQIIAKFRIISAKNGWMPTVFVWYNP